jgi:phospholipase/carboxylesterase
VLSEHGLGWDRTVLGGFSQGAVMSYALAFGAGRPRPAAVLAFSGFLPSVEGFDLALADRAGLPVSISHGTLDPVISVGFSRDARERLTAAGLNVRYREDPVGHTIAPAAIAQARAVLEDAVPA